MKIWVVLIAAWGTLLAGCGIAPTENGAGAPPKKAPGSRRFAEEVERLPSVQIDLKANQRPAAPSHQGYSGASPSRVTTPDGGISQISRMR